MKSRSTLIWPHSTPCQIKHYSSYPHHKWISGEYLVHHWQGTGLLAPVVLVKTDPDADVVSGIVRNYWVVLLNWRLHLPATCGWRSPISQQITPLSRTVMPWQILTHSGFSFCNSCSCCASLSCQHRSSESGLPHANWAWRASLFSWMMWLITGIKGGGSRFAAMRNMHTVSCSHCKRSGHVFRLEAAVMTSWCSFYTELNCSSPCMCPSERAGLSCKDLLGLLCFFALCVELFVTEVP